MSPNSIYLIVASVFGVVIGLDIYNWSKGRKLFSRELKLRHRRKQIDTSVFVLGFTCLAASTLFHINIIEYHRPIQHADVATITLQDFIGFKRPNQTLDGSNEFAFIVTSIEYEMDDHQVEIKAIFHPSRSYVFNERLVDKFLLEHELYHFHITELHARLIRSQLAALNQMPTVNQVERIVNTQRTSEYIMQKEYDNDTYHSYVLKKQKAWQGKIDSLLSSHQKFAQTAVRFPLTP